MKNKSICIIGAMDCEISRFKSALKNIEIFEQGTLTFYKGTMADKEVVVVKSGVGKVCAAACTQILADKFNPEFIINTGVAGGLKHDMGVGDIVAADKLVQHDFDATAIGYAKGYICNNINPSEPTYFYPDKILIEKFENVIKNKFPEMKYHHGVIASGDMFVGSTKKKLEIKEMFDAVAVEMEGAAIAHAATLNNIPFLIIRSISDLAEEKSGQSHKFCEESAADISAKTVEALIEQL